MDLKIWLLSGWRGTGKTPICQQIARNISQEGFDVAGLLSTAVYRDGKKESIWVTDIRSGEKRLLISSVPISTQEIKFGKWYIQSVGLDWGNQILSGIDFCDLLIIDELGPLELEFSRGWQAGLDLLHKGNYKIALVVVRPELIENAELIFQPCRIIELTSGKDINQEAKKLSSEILIKLLK